MLRTIQLRSALLNSRFLPIPVHLLKTFRRTDENFNAP
ncbi:hypothetical protein FB99_46860 (plasmid) [Pantoea agglomerans]|nr:hypothetical protein FB99_46860 [Pantoea agglomerans]